MTKPIVQNETSERPNSCSDRILPLRLSLYYKRNIHRAAFDG